MITNDRQYRMTLAQMEKFAAALRQFDTAGHRGHRDPMIVKAQRDSLQSQHDELEEQIREFETLKRGEIRHLEGRSIEAVADMLIRARIALNLTQKELADKLGIQEQQVQRYEAEGYRSASFHRVVEFYNALGLEIRISADIRDWRAVFGEALTRPTAVPES